jgi:hypothetical protein
MKKIKTKIHLTDFFTSKSGKIIISVLLGLGLSAIFRTVCKGDNCIIFYAPQIETIDDKIFKHDDKCYSYKMVSTTCNKNKKDVIIKPTYGTYAS